MMDNTLAVGLWGNAWMGEVCAKLQVHIGDGFVGRFVDGGSMCKASSSYW